MHLFNGSSSDLKVITSDFCMMKIHEEIYRDYLDIFGYYWKSTVSGK